VSHVRDLPEFSQFVITLKNFVITEDAGPPGSKGIGVHPVHRQAGFRRSGLRLVSSPGVAGPRPSGAPPGLASNAPGRRPDHARPGLRPFKPQTLPRSVCRVADRLEPSPGGRGLRHPKQNGSWKVESIACHGESVCPPGRACAGSGS